MKLISLTMHNFMPYRNKQNVVFPDDPNRNVMIVLGNNMRGKTSLLNALRWGFYGTAMGRHLRIIPLHELHNSDAGLTGDWEMGVSIQFDANGHKYDLRRQAVKKRLVAKPTRPEDFDVTIMMQRDGIAIPGYQIDAEINKYIPEQVSRFFLFDGELLQEYETLLIEGNEQGRRIKEAIEQVLGVPALIHGRDEVATLLKKSQKQQSIDLAHLHGVERLVSKQREFQIQQDSFEKDIINLKEKLQKIRDERTSFDDEIEKSDSIYKAKITLTELLRQRDQIIKEQENLKTAKLDLVSHAWSDLLKPKLLLRRDQLIEKQRFLTNQIGRRSTLKSDIRQLKSLLESSYCPMCSQEVSKLKRDEVGVQLGHLEVELRNIEDDQEILINVSAELDKLNRIINKESVGNSIYSKDQQMNHLEVQLTKVENESEKLQEEIKGYDTAEIARKRVMRDNLIKEEGRLESSIADSQRSLEKMRQELLIITRQLNNFPEARANRSSTLVNLYTSLAQVFEESIERLRDSLRQHVGERASEAFCSMITQRAYKGLQINKNYGLSIIDDHGKIVSGRSAGAEQIVALSLIDGLGRTGRADGPIVMDTPFGRLDLKHRDNILQYLPTTTSQLILLVHDGEIRPESDLAPIASRIGITYQIKEVGPRHSIIERRSLYG